MLRPGPARANPPPRKPRWRAALLLALASFSSALHVSCLEDHRARSLVLITLDTLRADHVSAYGGTVRTPHLDALARRGVLFEQASAAVPLTAPSHATILTGLYPWHHGVRLNGSDRLDGRPAVLAEDLSRAGRATAAFVAAVPLARPFGLDRGFGTYDDRFGLTAQGEPLPRRRGDEVTDRALDWLRRRHGGGPFFLWVHYYDPHAPYTPPEPFRGRYPDRPYAGEVAWTDAQVGRLLDGMADLGLLDSTLVVAVGDHGEGLDDHGEREHGLLLYEESLRVPWILAGPGVPAGGRVERPVSLVDVRPTVLDLLGLGPCGCDGTDRSAELAGEEGKARPAYAETLYPEAEMGWSRLRSVRSGPLKAIEAPRPELYDLDSDPGEHTDLAAARPGDLARLLALLPEGDGGAGGAEAAPDPSVTEALESLGYLGGRPATAGPGRAAGGGEPLPDPKDRIADYGEFWRAIHLGFEDGPAGAEAAVEVFRGLAARDPRNPQFRYKLALVLERTRHPDEAEVELRAVREERPDWSPPVVRLGDLLVAGGRPREAVGLLKAYLEGHPGEAGLHGDVARGLALALRAAGDREAALGVAREFAAAAPRDPAARLLVGHLAGEAGHFAESIEAFEEVISEDPGNPRASLSLSRVLVAAGRRPEALARLQAALALHPDDADLRTEALRLEKGR